MAYCWQTDPNPSGSHEDQHKHKGFHSVNQTLSSGQVSLGFDQLVDDISSKIPLYEKEMGENNFSVLSAPNWNSKRHLLDETHQMPLNEFTSNCPELCWHQGTKAPVIGFSPSVLPNSQQMNKESSWGYPVRQYHGAEDSRFNIFTPFSTCVGKINTQEEMENENPNYYLKFKSTIPPQHPSFSPDFMPGEKNKRSGHVNTVDPSLMLFEGSFPPRTLENTRPKNVESIGCSIQLAEVPQGSNKSLASFCDKVNS